MAVYRYIELNPVRAAMVERPERYRWSSVHANLGLIDDPMVTPHARYLALGATRTDRAAAYRKLLGQAIDPADTEHIRLHLQQERALGNQRFQAMVEKALGTPAQARPRGRPRRAPADIEET